MDGINAFKKRSEYASTYIVKVCGGEWDKRSYLSTNLSHEDSQYAPSKGEWANLAAACNKVDFAMPGFAR